MSQLDHRQSAIAAAELSGRVRDYLGDYDLTLIDHPAGAIVIPGRVGAPGMAVRVMIRPDAVSLATGRPGTVSIRSALAGVVAAVEPLDGPFASVSVLLSGGETLRATVTWLAVDVLGLTPGVPVHAMAKSVQISAGRPRS